VPDPRDAEDILQDVFSELVEANRLLMPIETRHGLALSRARNRITDLFSQEEAGEFQRCRRAPTMMMRTNSSVSKTCCLRPRPGRTLFMRATCFLMNSRLALEELPEEQREVFVAHELEGRSFKEMAAKTGVSVNTLLSRKRYAVLHLRSDCKTSTTNL